MSIRPTKPGYEGTRQEDIMSGECKGPYLSYFARLFEEVSDIIQEGSMSLGGRVVEESGRYPIKNIRELTLVSSYLRKDAFFIFDFPLTQRTINLVSAMEKARIIIAGGKRYLIRGGSTPLGYTSYADFHFIEIERREVFGLVERIKSGEKF